MTGMTLEMDRCNLLRVFLSSSYVQGNKINTVSEMEINSVQLRDTTLDSKMDSQEPELVFSIEFLQQ